MSLDRVVNRAGTKGATGNVPMHGKRIQAGLSTQIVIMVKDDDGKEYTIGAVQSLAVNQTRSIKEITEIGTDAIIQYVPNSATTYDIKIDRIVFDFQRLPQALQRDFRHIGNQRRPFDIIVVDYNPYLTGPDEASANTAGSDPAGSRPNVNTSQNSGSVKTTFGNCWFSSLNYTFTANDYLITESCSLNCEYVKDEDIPVKISSDIDEVEAVSNTSAQASVMSQFDRDI